MTVVATQATTATTATQATTATTATTAASTQAATPLPHAHQSSSLKTSLTTTTITTTMKVKCPIKKSKQTMMKHTYLHHSSTYIQCHLLTLITITHTTITDPNQAGVIQVKPRIPLKQMTLQDRPGIIPVLEVCLRMYVCCSINVSVCVRVRACVRLHVVVLMCACVYVVYVALLLSLCRITLCGCVVVPVINTFYVHRNVLTPRVCHKRLVQTTTQTARLRTGPPLVALRTAQLMVLLMTMTINMMMIIVMAV